MHVCADEDHQSDTEREQIHLFQASWKAVLSFHPSNRTRLEAVDAPTKGVSFALCLSAGTICRIVDETGAHQVE